MRDRESGLEGCFPSTKERENACWISVERGGRLERGTAGMISNIRGSVSAFLVSASIVSSSRTVKLDKSSVRGCMISGSGLSDPPAAGSGFSKSSSGGLIY